MRPVRKTIELAAIIFASVIFCSAQAPPEIENKKIKVCPVEITDAARTVAFRFKFIYILEAEPGGEIPKIREIVNPQAKMKAKFVRDELFIECMKKWQLEQEGRYHVVFSVGTTSIGSTEGMPFNYMRVTDPAKRSIIIDLSAPRRAKTN